MKCNVVVRNASCNIDSNFKIIHCYLFTVDKNVLHSFRQKYQGPINVGYKVKRFFMTLYETILGKSLVAKK